MTHTHGPSFSAPTQETIAAARLLLAQMNISPSDLVGAVYMPTFTEAIAKARVGLTGKSPETYGTHFDRLEKAWGSRRLDEVTKADLEEMAEVVRATALARRNTRGGRSAVEHFIGATRRVYRYAEDSGWMRPADNPARQLVKPQRLSSNRYAIGPDRLREICGAASSSGNDTELDGMLLRLHLETACRRGGALALRPHDLDADQCLIHLREKGGTDRWQPVSPTLMAWLQDHVTQRGSPLQGQLLRYRSGKPITKRRYDHLWVRIGSEVPWVAAQNVSTHWLRHTTLTWVERNYSFAVARAYAGHQDASSTSTTATYVRAQLDEVAAALAALTGEPHPLAARNTHPNSPPMFAPGFAERDQQESAGVLVVQSTVAVRPSR